MSELALHAIEAFVLVFSLSAAAFAAWRMAIIRALKDACEALTSEVESIRRQSTDCEARNALLNEKVKLLRNQVRTLLEFIRDNRIVGAAKAARVIAAQMDEDDAEEEDQPSPAKSRRRTA